MLRSLARTVLVPAFVLLFAVPLPADDQAGATAAAEKAARAALARFDKGDPGWKVRMEALVGLAKIGPSAVPVLVKGLKDGPPTTAGGRARVDAAEGRLRTPRDYAGPSPRKASARRLGSCGSPGSAWLFFAPEALPQRCRARNGLYPAVWYCHTARPARSS